MEKEKATEFLFAIGREVKQFYETPVIFLTKKNYSDPIFDALCLIRRALIEGKSKDDMIDIIVDYHLQWIRTVTDLENFKKLVNENAVSREEVFEAVSFTIDALNSRLKHFQKYMEHNKSSLSNSEQANLNTEIEIIKEMHKDITQELLTKLTCFRSFQCDKEFKIQVMNVAEELLDWIDRINDSISIQLSKFMDVSIPHLSTDLTKTLQQIIKDINLSDTASAHKALEEIRVRENGIESMIRCTVSHNLEISKVVEKIAVLNDRIKRLESEPTSAALLALTHKKEYLENRLTSLEKLKTTITNLHNEAGIDITETDTENMCICQDFFNFRIFNHSLPIEERERLVTELCYLWDLALFGERSRKSIISIMSAVEVKEEFTDDLGTYFIDEYSRKIYKLPGDDTLYQPNEANELVPLSDDSEHVYFFDECGRYFFDPKTRQRVYKAHATASEYMMDSTGVLLKTKEERDGIVYYYDNFGRYYINDEGKSVYREPDSISEYENDGLGNLVRIRSQMDIFELCPEDTNVTEDFKYLKQTVGSALRTCLAQCILTQPADPIKYLSTSLMKYRENIEANENWMTEKEVLLVERKYYMEREQMDETEAAREAALHDQSGSEASYDSNLVNYTTENLLGNAATSGFK